MSTILIFYAGFNFSRISGAYLLKINAQHRTGDRNRYSNTKDKLNSEQVELGKVSTTRRRIAPESPQLHASIPSVSILESGHNDLVQTE